MSHPGSESERGKSQSVRSVAWQQIHCDNDPVQIQCTLPVACCSPTFLVISVASAISLHTYIYTYIYICIHILIFACEISRTSLVEVLFDRPQRGQV